MTREQAEQIALRNYGWSSMPPVGDKQRMIIRCVDAILEAVAIEREACAKVCDAISVKIGWPTEIVISDECAAAIRARSA